MATLSMEPRNQITTLHNYNHSVLPLIQSVVGVLLDSRNDATASKPDVARVTAVLKWYKLFWARDMPLGINISTGTWYLLLCLYEICTLSIIWTVLMFIFCVCAWARFSGSEAQEGKLHVCYTAHSCIHCSRVTHKFLQNFSSNSSSTRVQMSSLKLSCTVGRTLSS